MKFLVFFIVILANVLFIKSSFAIGYVVGNGGDGLLISGKLFVRDLVESGVQFEPYVGSKVVFSKGFKARLRAMSIDEGSLPFSRELLAAKLSDLENLSPYLGHFVLEAILAYRWIAVDSALAPIGDYEMVLKELPANQVQIANRLDTTIRVHNESWNRLNDRNKIALIIHEAIYSLLKPKCEESPYRCFQSARVARNIVGKLFMADFFHNRSDQQVRKLVEKLEIPLEMIRPTVSKRIWNIEWVSPEGAAVSSVKLALDLPLTNPSVKNYIDSTCREFEQHQELDSSKDFLLRTSIQLPPYEKRMESYPTFSGGSTGVPEYQLRVAIALRYDEMRFRHGEHLFKERLFDCRYVMDIYYNLALE